MKAWKPFVFLMNHLSRGGKNVSVVRGTLWLNLHCLPHFPQNDSTNGDYKHNSFPHISSPFPFFPSSIHGLVAVPQPCSVLLTWSASEVDSMLISSRSAVSLHICSHFIFRNLSSSSKITPEGKHGAENKRTMMSRVSQGPSCSCADSAAKTGHEIIWHIWLQSLNLFWGTDYQCWLQPRLWEGLPFRHQVFTEQDPQIGNFKLEKRYLNMHCYFCCFLSGQNS